MAIDLDQDIHGSSQGDVLSGGGGNDRLFGGAGNDTMNGAAGSDSLNGGSGNDTLVYNLSANAAAGTADTYMGGSGVDTLWLQFTRAEWLTHQVQSQLAAYLAHLAAVTNPNTGQVANGVASDFVFTFGSSTLAVQMVENLRVSVDGVELTAGNDPVTAVADSASALEDGPAVDIAVLANDSVPDLVATLALATAPVHGTATLMQPDAGDPSTWYFRYQPHAAHFQYLAKDQTATDSFTYTVTDPDGSTATATVAVSVTGSNDAPVVAVEDVTGAVTEMSIASGNLTDTGTITFSDVDLADAHSLGPVTASAGALGTLAAGVTADTTGSGTGGVVTWNYSVAAAAAEYLAAGETRTESFSFDVSDGNGGSVARTVNVTLTGTNDAPQLADTTDPEPVLEQAGSSWMDLAAVTGSFTATDPDANDTLAARVVGAPVVRLDGQPFALPGSAAGLVGAGVFTLGPVASGPGSRSVGYTYDPTNAGLDFLGKDQRLTITYAVEVQDGSASSNTQDVTFAIVGTNDAPGVLAAQVTYDVSEDGVTGLGGDQPFTDDYPDISGHTVVPVTSYVFGTNAPAHGVLTASVAQEPAPGGGTGNVSWSYSLAPDAYRLSEGEQLIEVHVMHVVDQHGAWTNMVRQFVVHGTNDAPVVAAEDVTADVTELGTPSGDLTDSGTIAFTDLDPADVHSVGTVTPSPGALGILTAGVSSDTTGSGTGGVVTWNYSVAAAAAEDLAAGETRTESFSFDLSDGHGASVTRTVNVTLTGTNDAPEFAPQAGDTLSASIVDPAGAAPEWTSTTGYVHFIDPDVNDIHPGSGGGLATTSTGGSPLGIFGGAGDPDRALWVYNIAGDRLDSLAAGQTVTETGTLIIFDNHGGQDSIQIPVTVVGTNDGPVVLSEDLDGAVTEAGTPSGDLTDTGTIAFSDPDLSDVHSVGAVTASAGALGTLTANVTSDTTGSGTGGVVTWNYSVAAAAAEYLAEGETKTETFSFELGDGNGGSVTRSVNVTLTGTNDAPVVSAPVAGSAVEGGPPVTLSAMVNATDPDQGDVLEVVNVDGVLPAGVSWDATSRTFTLDPAHPAYQSLTAGQQATVTVGFGVSDGVAATAAQAQWTITGTALQRELVGAWRVGEGPTWSTNPPVYSATEAAAYLFGGNAASYDTSVSATSVTNTAWYDGWGKPLTVLPESFKQDAPPAGYQYPSGDAWSALVADHAAVTGFGNYGGFNPLSPYPYTNYAYRSVQHIEAAAGASTVGTSGDDKIYAAADSEVTGGSGADYFHFAGPTVRNVAVTDFRSGEDTLLISHAGFGASLQPGGVSSLQFVTGAAFTSGNQRFLFNSGTHELWFDADGNGAGAGAVLIGSFGPATVLTQQDLVVL